MKQRIFLMAALAALVLVSGHRDDSIGAAGAHMLAATRIGVQRHRRPNSIKSRDKLAMVLAFDSRADRSDSSELVISCIA